MIGRTLLKDLNLTTEQLGLAEFGEDGDTLAAR